MHDKPLVRFLGQFLLLQTLFWFEFKIKDLLPSPHVFCSVCCFVSQCFLVALKTFSLNSVFIEYNINCQPSVAKASEYWEGVCTEYVEVCVVCVCVCMCVCWIFTRWTLTLWVCLCIWVCEIEIEKCGMCIAVKLLGPRAMLCWKWWDRLNRGEAKTNTRKGRNREKKIYI